MKTIVISEKRWEELWNTFLDKIKLEAYECKDNCPMHQTIPGSLKKRFQYHVIGLKQDIENSVIE
jgi:hypothetical protein